MRRQIAWPLPLLLLGAACTDFAGHDLDMAIGNVPQLSTMRQTVAYQAQEMPRLPADGAVPVINPMGDVPPAYGQGELDQVSGTLVNPLPRTAEVLARGALVYQRQCFACHGPDGNTPGPIVGLGRFPFAPPIGAGAPDRSEGYIYAITDVGRGLMPPYGPRIPHLDRWAVATYVRHLQQGGAVLTPGMAPARMIPRAAAAPEPQALPAPQPPEAAPPAELPAEPTAETEPDDDIAP